MSMMFRIMLINYCENDDTVYGNVCVVCVQIYYLKCYNRMLINVVTSCVYLSIKYVLRNYDVKFVNVCTVPKCNRK